MVNCTYIIMYIFTAPKNRFALLINLQFKKSFCSHVKMITHRQNYPRFPECPDFLEMSGIVIVTIDLRQFHPSSEVFGCNTHP
jgi:hypothetical protein